MRLSPVEPPWAPQQTNNHGWFPGLDAASVLGADCHKPWSITELPSLGTQTQHQRNDAGLRVSCGVDQAGGASSHIDKIRGRARAESWLERGSLVPSIVWRKLLTVRISGQTVASYEDYSTFQCVSIYMLYLCAFEVSAQHAEMFSTLGCKGKKKSWLYIVPKY